MPVTDPRRLPNRGQVIAINSAREPTELLVRYVGGATRILTGDRLEQVPGTTGARKPPSIAEAEQEYVKRTARMALFDRGGIPRLRDDVFEHERYLSLLCTYSDLTPAVAMAKMGNRVDRQVFMWESSRFEASFPVVTELGDIPNPESLQELLIQLHAIRASPRTKTQAFARVARPLEAALSGWYGVTQKLLMQSLRPVIASRIANGLVETLATPSEQNPKPKTKGKHGRPTMAEQMRKEFPGLLRPAPADSREGREEPFQPGRQPSVPARGR